MNARLRVYTKREWDNPESQSDWRGPQTHNFLAPVLPKLHIHQYEATDWARFGHEYLELVEHPQQADAITVPNFYYLIEKPNLREAADLATQLDRFLLLFGHTDHYEQPSAFATKTLLFHSDLYHSKQKPYQRVHPSLLMSEMNPYKLLSERDWYAHPHESTPEIFWRGAGDMAMLPLQRRILFQLTRNWRSIRLRTVSALARSHEITLHSTFSTGWWQLDEEEQLQKKRKFVQEALSAPYALVVRGSGNYSFRLYEVMALGRIPVIIDTDSALPWPERIDWSDIAVIVPRRDIRKIGQIIHTFHNRFSPSEFTLIQSRIRGIWEHYLSEVGFYRTVCEDALKSSQPPRSSK